VSETVVANTDMSFIFSARLVCFLNLSIVFRERVTFALTVKGVFEVHCYLVPLSEYGHLTSPLVCCMSLFFAEGRDAMPSILVA
jgi:hypothetical protein